MKHRGFTLIELLVAMFITAILFAMGYGAINQAIANRAAIEEQQARLLAVQTTMRLMAQDFAQLTPRPVREPVGDGWQPALRAEPRGQPLVALTRGGWANPAGIQRPALERVSYFLENDKLRREHWPVLDATLASTTIKREMLDKVRSVTIRYMSMTRQWRDQWPPATPGDPEAMLRIRPVAVEVTLELEDWGRIVRIFEVPG